MGRTGGAAEDSRDPQSAQDMDVALGLAGVALEEPTGGRGEAGELGR